MPRTSRRRVPSRSSGPRRRTTWARSHLTFTIATASTQQSGDILADFKSDAGLGANPPGLTIGGGWLTWAFLADAAVGAGIIARVTVGIIVVDEITAAQVPSLASEEHADWMWYQTAWIPEGEQSTVHDHTGAGLIQWRSKRRMDEIGMNIYMGVFANVAGSAEAHTSTLLVLP